MLLSITAKSGKFQLRRDKRHLVVPVLICNRLARLHIGKESHYVHILLTVFQSLRFGMGQKSSLAFFVNTLCIWGLAEAKSL